MTKGFIQVIGKQLLSFLSSFLFLSLVTFLLTKASPIDPAENYLRASNIVITEENLAQARDYLQLNRSTISQYISWLTSVLTGDFGISYILKTPVLPLVWSRFCDTLLLAFPSFLLTLLLSSFLGIVSGLKKGSWFDKVIYGTSLLFVSIPNFWLAYLLMLYLGVYLGWLPISGRQGWSSLILPSLTLSLPMIGQYTALIRKEVQIQLEQPHVEMARLRGVREGRILWNHILRNAAPTLLTGYSLAFIYLLTGSLVVEEIFSWKGLGSLFVESLQAMDVPVIQACMLLFGSLFLLNHCFLRRMIGIIDPRLRKQN